MRARNLRIGLPIFAGSLLCATTALAQTPDTTSTPAPTDGMPAAAVTAPAMDSAPVGGGEKQKDRGIVVSLGITARTILVNPGVNNSAGAGNIGGELFAGYKYGRYIAGLGFSVSHLGSATKYAAITGQPDGSRSDTSFMISPGLQVAILQSAEKRVELLGAVKLGFGRTVSSRSQSPTIPPDYLPAEDETNFHMAWEIGPGLRFWFHQQFAMTLVSGAQVDHLFFKQNNPSGMRADTQTAVGMFGTLGMTGVF